MVILDEVEETHFLTKKVWKNSYKRIPINNYKKNVKKKKEKSLLEHYSSDCCRQDSSLHVEVIGQ